MAMISNFSYEKNILNLAKQLLAEANFHSVSNLLMLSVIYFIEEFLKKQRKEGIIMFLFV